MNTAQHTTMYDINSQVSNNIKDCSPLQHSCDSKGMKPAIGYCSLTHQHNSFD